MDGMQGASPTSNEGMRAGVGRLFGRAYVARLPALVARLKAQHASPERQRQALWQAVANDCVLLRELIMPFQDDAIDVALGTVTPIGDAGQVVAAPSAGHDRVAPSPTPTAEEGRIFCAPSAGQHLHAPSAVPPLPPSPAELAAAGATLRAAQGPRKPPEKSRDLPADPRVFKPRRPPHVQAAVDAALVAVVVECRLKSFIVNGQPVGELKPPEVIGAATVRRREAQILAHDSRILLREARFLELLCAGVPDVMKLGVAHTTADGERLYQQAVAETSDV